MLAVCGGALGILLAVGGIELLKSLATTLGRMDLGIQLAFPRLDDMTIDLTVLVFVFGLSVLAGVVLGLMPAIAHSRTEHMTLRETTPAYSGFRLSARGGSATVLVAAEISLAMILLVGAGLLAHSFMKLTRVDSGYDAANVLTFQVALPLERYPTAQLKSFADGLVAQLRTIPGVKAAAYGQPPLVAITEGAFFRKTPEVPTKAAAAGVERRLVSTDYLDVMGIRVLAGRGFTEHDRAGHPRVPLINQALARREFPAENPIGRHVYAGTDSQPWEIVGIVTDVRQVSIDREPDLQCFVTYDQWPGDAAFPLGPDFSLRTETDPARFVPLIHAHGTTVGC